MISQKRLNSYLEKEPLLKNVMNLEPVIWLNPYKKKFYEANIPDPTRKEMDEVVALWKRFAPYLKKVFQELAESEGRISSPLKEIPVMQSKLAETKGSPVQGKMYVKCDSDLAVAGSIKARGGFYEVLDFAEQLAKDAGLIDGNKDYAQFDSKPFKDLFTQYKIAVASTGNLGLSIGIISAQLGFKVDVYMSGDAKEWKKKLLREKGAIVLEFDGEFRDALLAARQRTDGMPNTYFVDDEKSRHLYLGYSAGALELQKDLEKKGIVVDEDHPLFVYSPCGVGGSPGGTAFGLKHIYGDHVHCFFVEPTNAPAVLLGIATEAYDFISVQDLGIVNRTEADGLAVGRSSKFATRISQELISGIYTIEDDRLFKLLADLWDTEEIFLEPSATAGLIGPEMLAKTNYVKINQLNMDNATHIVWATGGALVPQSEREEFYERGKRS